MAERDDLNVSMIATVGVVSVTLTVVSVFAVRALFNSYLRAEKQRKVIQIRAVDSDSKLAEQEARLTRYSWVNREQGTATIPIELAMRLVVAELRADQDVISPTAEGGTAEGGAAEGGKGY